MFSEKNTYIFVGRWYIIYEVGVFVCCHPIYPGRQGCGRTSRGHTGGKLHGFLHLASAVFALIFMARRIPSSLSLVDRDVEFCVPTS